MSALWYLIDLVFDVFEYVIIGSEM